MKECDKVTLEAMGITTRKQVNVLVKDPTLALKLMERVTQSLKLRAPVVPLNGPCLVHQYIS